MSSATWWPQFEETLRKHLPLLSDEQPMTPDLELVECGLDSQGMVGLLLELEDGFSVEIPDDKLIAATFRTAQSLWLTIAELVDSR
jgi:acyl carrier protein